MSIIGGGFIPAMFGRGMGLGAGVEWNQSTDTWTVLDSSNYASILADITRVNLAAAGTVNAEHGGVGYAEDGSNGRVMVRIPKFYVAAYRPTANVYRWDVATSQISGGYAVHPAFVQRGGVERDYIYVGAYEADGYDDAGTFKLHSRAGVTPVTGEVAYPDLPNAGRFHIDDAEDYGNNIGAGWGSVNVWSWSAVKLLMLLDWGNLDSQTELGMGIVDKASGTGFNGELTGAFNINSNLDATLTGAGDDGLAGEASDGLRPVTWRGIENPWGNTWQFVIGYNSTDAEYRIVKKAGLASATMSGTLGAGDYEASVAQPLGHDGYVNGYISNIVWESLMELMLHPSAIGGSASTYIPDNYWSHYPGRTNILLAGGNWASGARAGAGGLASSFPASSSDRSLGGRLEFIEQ